MTISTHHTLPYLTVVPGDGGTPAKSAAPGTARTGNACGSAPRPRRGRPWRSCPETTRYRRSRSPISSPGLAYDHGESVRVADLRALRPQHIAAFLEGTRWEASQGTRILFATRSASENLATISLARAADCAMLCVSPRLDLAGGRPGHHRAGRAQALPRQRARPGDCRAASVGAAGWVAGRRTQPAAVGATMSAPALDDAHHVVVGRDLLPQDGTSDTLAAVTNALKLGSSLVATLAIAVAVKFLMPRYLGPSSFGTLSFADGFTGTFFMALSLGAEAYVRKEVSVRPAHASDFLGGTLVLRAMDGRGHLRDHGARHARDRPLPRGKDTGVHLRGRSVLRERQRDPVRAPSRRRGASEVCPSSRSPRRSCGPPGWASPS